MAKMTIPVKGNVNKNRGAILLSILDIKESVDDMHLITLGNLSIVINKSKEGAVLSLIKDENKTPSTSFDDNELDILINWEDDNIWVDLFNKDLLPVYIDTISIKGEVNFNNVLSLFEGNFYTGVYKKIISYNDNLVDEEISSFSLEAFKESTEILFEANFTTPTHYKKDVIIEDTFAPIDGAPILLEDDKGPLRRQFFFDEETAEYTNEVKERFLYLGEDYFNLAYSGIEPSYKMKVEFEANGLSIFYEGEKLKLRGQQLYLNLTNEEKEDLYGHHFTVRYQLERSYNVEFNEDVPHDGFRINLVNMKPDKEVGGHYSSTENIKLLREGNRFEDQYLAKEIELNPLINPQVQGFMYIDKTPQVTNDFRISVSSDYLIGNGVDTASVMIEAIDGEGNEVLSPYLSVYIMNDKGEIGSSFGRIEPVIGYNSMKARNTSGRAYYELTAPILTDNQNRTSKIFVIAYDRKNGISAQYPLYIRATKEEEIFDIKQEDNSALEIPFEYFARYFDKELSKDNPMVKFDNNMNGRLDREDMKNFKKIAKEDLRIKSFVGELLLKEEHIDIREDTRWVDVVKFTWDNFKSQKWQNN